MMEKKLPEGWIWVDFGEIVSYQKGKKPAILGASEFDRSLPYLDIRALERGEIREYADEDSSILLQEGDIAIVWDGARCGWVSLGQKGSLGSTLGKITPVLCSRNFIFYFLKKHFLLLNTNPTGIGIPHLNGNLLWTLPFPLPPLQVQQQIAEKLDRLMGYVREAQVALDEVPVLLKAFRQKVLAMAVSGELTKEWREANEDIESTEQLFQRMILERKSRYKKSCELAIQSNMRKPRKLFEEDLPEIEDFSEITVPVSWAKTHIGFLAFVTKLAGFEYSKYFDVKETGDVGLIRAQNVHMGEFIDDNIVYLDKSVSDQLERSKIKGNEVLMVFIGAGTGNVCLAPDYGDWHLAPNVAKIECDFINRRYLNYYLQSPIGFHCTSRFIKATAQPSLSMETIREIEVIVPPLPEQDEIIKQINFFFLIADAIESDYEAAKDELESLPQAILSRGFSGKLTPFKVGSENALALLERIREEKAKLKMLGKRKARTTVEKKVTKSSMSTNLTIKGVLEKTPGVKVPVKEVLEKTKYNKSKENPLDMDGFYEELKTLTPSPVKEIRESGQIYLILEDHAH